MEARYSKRIQAKGKVIITVGSHVCEGRILDLTVPGCLLESSIPVNKGDSVQLTLFLPGFNLWFEVLLAAVRWRKGVQFGVEFIKMGERDQREFAQFMAR